MWFYGLDGGGTMTGDIGEVPLPDLLQLFAASKKSGKTPYENQAFADTDITSPDVKDITFFNGCNVYMVNY